MKIGIVTLIGEFNYGNLLQSYALQTVLERMGHSVVVFNRRIPRISYKLQLYRIMSFIKSLIMRYVKGRKDILIVNPFAESYCTRDRIDSVELKRFVRENINRSVALRSSYEMQQFAIKEKFDAYVVGSDQVWREDYAQSIDEMFLSFLPDDNHAIRIAYAASFGTDYNPISKEKLSMCTDLLKRFSAISVRERDAVEKCRTLFGVEAFHVLDPTMLLTKEDYRNIIDRNGTPRSKGNLLTYILDETDEINVLTNKIAEFLNLDSFSVNSLEKADSISYVYRFPSVEAWVRGFYDAEFVVTDSFHACVFSIIFNKPFVCLGNKDRGNARFESLLEMFGLQERIINEANKLVDVLNHNIDWEHVNEILKRYNLHSKDFLDHALYEK